MMNNNERPNLNERNVTVLLEWLKSEIAHHQPMNTFDFVSGLSQFASSFSVWRNGEEYFGSSDYTLKELNEAVKRHFELQK